MENILQQRDNDFVNVIRSAIANRDRDHKPSTSAIIRQVLSMPAPRYYVDFDTAYKAVSRIHENGLPRCVNSNKQQMWIDLATTVYDYLNTHPGSTRLDALGHILETCTAPSFYLSEATARIHYYRLIRQQKSNKNSNNN